MEKQIELKAKIGEVQLEMDSIQSRFNQLVQFKTQLIQALNEEISKAVSPVVKPVVKEVKSKEVSNEKTKSKK